MSRVPRRVISIGHSYCVALNRRLADEIARAGSGKWEVTAVAPVKFHGDLRSVALEPSPDERCRLEPVPVHMSRLVHLMLYGPRLRAILRSSWDVVHCWEEPYVFAGGQVAMLAPREAALVFATFQNILKRYPPPFAWIERASMRRASGWIAFGRTVDETLRTRAGYAGRPGRVIPLGVDVERFRLDPAARADTFSRLAWDMDGPPVVGYLGRFVPEKGIELLTGSLEGLDGAWRALFVGAGPLEGYLRGWSKRHGDRVRIVTGVVHDDVPAYLNAMDVLCAPSRTTPRWREQFGRMVIEGFACGLPVVGSDSGELPYVIADAGIVVEEGDQARWVHALDGLLGSPERRLELSRRGVERARTVYAWPHVARQHLEFFDELLDARRGS